MPTLAEILLNSFTAIVAALVSAALTLFVSLKRFRSERWWERQAEVYSQLLGYLVDVKRFSEVWLSHVRERPGEYPQIEDGPLSERSNEAWRELSRTSTIGAFIISNRAAAVLEELKTESARLEYSNLDPPEQMEARLAAVEDALTKLRKIAKQDLKRPWF